MPACRRLRLRPAGSAYPLPRAAAPPSRMRPTGRADIHFRAQPRRRSCIGPAEGAYPLLCAAAPPIVHGADGGACARFPMPACRRLRLRPAGSAYPLPRAAAPPSRMGPTGGRVRPLPHAGMPQIAHEADGKDRRPLLCAGASSRRAGHVLQANLSRLLRRTPRDTACRGPALLAAPVWRLWEPRTPSSKRPPRAAANGGENWRGSACRRFSICAGGKNLFGGRRFFIFARNGANVFP